MGSEEVGGGGGGTGSKFSCDCAEGFEGEFCDEEVVEEVIKSVPETTVVNGTAAEAAVEASTDGT